MIKTNCNLCGKNDFDAVRTSVDFDFHPEEAFTYVKCRNCGFVYLNPRPEGPEMVAYYPSDYYMVPRDSLYDFSRFDRVKYISEKQPAGKILDIGSNMGFFIKGMEQAGWDVYGCELSKFACDHAKGALGLKNIVCSDFQNAEYPGNFFDAITLWNVIEHLNDPIKALHKAYGLLKKGGIIYIDTQNYTSLLSKVFKGNWYQLDAPRHLFQFTPDTLNKALALPGFKSGGIKSCEPFITMVSFKVSLTRALGMSNKVSRGGKTGDDQSKKFIKKNFIWASARNISNFVLLGFSAVLILLGMGDTMLVWAKKE
jgi:SAM-dependent methyltransferase